MDGDQLIKTIDEVYYQDEKNFTLDHLTQKLPEDLNSEYILDYKSKLERLLTVVTRKVSELILSHQPTYVNELQRIADLQKSITESIRVCTQGRGCLRYIKDGTAKNGSTIVEHHQKRESLAKLLRSMTAISDLRRSVLKIRALIDSQEDFPRAILMCKDGKALLASHSQYKCVVDISIKLDQTKDFIIELLKSKLNQLTTSQEFSHDRFNEFLRCLRYMDSIVLMGDEFCGFRSKEELLSYINIQALNFFNAYHSSSVDELKIFLENELWEMLPVKSDFKLVHLKEFSFLRTDTSTSQSLNQVEENESEKIFTQEGEDNLNTTSNNNNNNKLDVASSNLQQAQTTRTSSDSGNRDDARDSSEDLFGAGGGYRGSYFNQREALPLDKISLSSDSDLDSELNKEFVDEDEATTTTIYRPTKISGPVLTNSSLNVLRLAGRYIQMMIVLSEISYDILMRVYKLLDHYTTFVFKKFGSDNDKELRVVISSLRVSLIGDQSSIEDASGMISRQTRTSESEPYDPKKAVAIESLIFLVNQLWNLQEYLETLISPEQRLQLREQFTQNYSAIPDFLKARADMGPNK